MTLMTQNDRFWDTFKKTRYNFCTFVLMPPLCSIKITGMNQNDRTNDLSFITAMTLESHLACTNDPYDPKWPVLPVMVASMASCRCGAMWPWKDCNGFEFLLVLFIWTKISPNRQSKAYRNPLGWTNRTCGQFVPRCNITLKFVATQNFLIVYSKPIYFMSWLDTYRPNLLHHKFLGPLPAQLLRKVWFCCEIALL